MRVWSGFVSGCVASGDESDPGACSSNRDDQNLSWSGLTLCRDNALSAFPSLTHTHTYRLTHTVSLREKNQLLIQSHTHTWQRYHPPTEIHNHSHCPAHTPLPLPHCLAHTPLPAPTSHIPLSPGKQEHPLLLPACPLTGPGVRQNIPVFFSHISSHFSKTFHLLRCLFLFPSCDKSPPRGCSRRTAALQCL